MKITSIQMTPNLPFIYELKVVPGFQEDSNCYPLWLMYLPALGQVICTVPGHPSYSSMIGVGMLLPLLSPSPLVGC